MTPNVPFRRGRRGFTLIEIMLVVVIIMIMVAVVGPRLVGQTKRAKIGTTKQQMENLKTALSVFEMHAGRFPTSSEGLRALIEKPSRLDEDEWPDRCLDANAVPKDAWKNDFNYRCPSDHGMDYDLVSAGPDEEFGTEDDLTNYGTDDGDNL